MNLQDPDMVAPPVQPAAETDHRAESSQPADRHDPAVRQAWAAFVSTLADGARLLEIGTGDGRVALLAQQTARDIGKRLQIDAADPATIDPTRTDSNAGTDSADICWHPHVEAHALPFEDASFDAVGGQFALEYTDLVPSLAQLYRVLKPGAEAQFLIHHADSELLRHARHGLAEGRLLFGEQGIFQLLRALLTMTQAEPEQLQQTALALRHGIAGLKDALMQERASGGGALLQMALQATQSLLRTRTESGPQVLAAEIDRTEQALRRILAQLQDLDDHALDAVRMRSLADHAKDAGFGLIEYSPQHGADGQLLGWLLLMQRS